MTNIFEDLGFSPEEAAALKVKAMILRMILSQIKKRGIAESDLPSLLGIDQATVSDLLNLRIGRFAEAQLLTFAERVGVTVGTETFEQMREPKLVRARLMAQGVVVDPEARVMTVARRAMKQYHNALRKLAQESD